jgi:S1-C subfamily serine protease
MRSVKYILHIALIVLAFSCSQSTYKTIYPTLSDGKYDSEFPYKNCSEQLSKISNSIKKISSIVFYRTYDFKLSYKIKKTDITKNLLKRYFHRSEIVSESINGTGTIIYKDFNKIALLTCSHVVNSKDTLYSYIEDRGSGERYIKSIAIKKSHDIYIPDIAVGQKFDVLASESTDDIAIIGLKTKEELLLRSTKFTYPLGNTKDLEWGSFVYIMGYPLGFPMITRGIVSSPQNISRGLFLIDAVFNHGFSGGLVLAVKDGVPNFEVVGIVKSASAQYENYLKPQMSSDKMIYNKNTPYKGILNVGVKESINYGITFSITIELIKKFYLKHRIKLLEKGYDFKQFFGNY